MTAFSTKEAEIAGFAINCEVRSVNHRYCDLVFKMPERLRFLEPDMRVLVSSKVSRGKIECAINCKKLQNQQQDFVVNESAVIALLNAAQAIEQHMATALAFSALDVLAFPGVQKELETDNSLLREGLLRLLQQVLADFVLARQREGAQLKTVITDRCGRMQELVLLAKQRMPEVLQNLRNKLSDRVVELVSQPDFDRLEQELVLLTQKMDIAEEIDRLETHIFEVLRNLEQPEPAGRRLDFLMQELNREANTLGSKANDKELTRIAIELKVLIEQVREQIQNIE